MPHHNTEKWKPIPGWESSYEVSNHGRVRSLDRTVIRSNGAPLPLRGRVLRPATLKHGYQQVALSEGTGASVEVHVLVAAAFIGPRPEGLEVCHNDGNPRNNHIDNLRYDTKSSNSHDTVRHGTHNNARKTECKHGHPLNGQNLKTYQGMRQCRACSNARSAIYPDGVNSPRFRTLADSYYAQIANERNAA